jgi:Tfp pilus assembly protein PilF
LPQTYGRSPKLHRLNTAFRRKLICMKTVLVLLALAMPVFAQLPEQFAAAEAQMVQGSWEEARRGYLALNMTLRKTLGPEHPQTILALANACGASVHLADRYDSLPLCTKALELREKVLGPDSPDTVRSLSDLALIYSSEGDLKHSGKLLERALHIAEADPRSKEKATLMNNLGSLYFRRGKYTQARAMFENAMVDAEAAHDNEALVTILGNLGTVELAARDAESARRHFRQSLAISQNQKAARGLSLAESAISGTRSGR